MMMSQSVLMEEKVVNEEPELGLEKVQETGSKKKVKHVLIVEDDMDMAMILDQVVHWIQPEANVEWASTAEQVVSIIESHAKRHARPPYDLIVSDIFLDGQGTGLDIWKLCQQTFEDTPIVLTSAVSSDRMALVLGENEISPFYLQKPFTLQECERTLMSAIDRTVPYI